MTKEEILIKNGKKNLNQDSGDKVILNRETTYGVAGMTLVTLVICAIRFFVKNEGASDILAVYAGYFVLSGMYKYKVLRDKKELVIAVLWMVAAFLGVVVYSLNR